MARALKVADRDPLMNPRIIEAPRKWGFFFTGLRPGELTGVAGVTRERALA
jgi:hypothetical protein